MTRRPLPRRPRTAGTGRLPVVLYAHPFELAFGLLLVLMAARASGVGGSAPLRFDVLLPGYVVVAYTIASSLGGLAILIGLAGRAHPFPRALEKAGLYLVAGAFLAYAVALVNLDGFPGTITGLIQAVIGGACFLRAEAIRLTERIVLEQLRAHNSGDADPALIIDLVDGTHSPRRIGRRRRQVR